MTSPSWISGAVHARQEQRPDRGRGNLQGWRHRQQGLRLAALLPVQLPNGKISSWFCLSGEDVSGGPDLHQVQRQPDLHVQQQPLVPAAVLLHQVHQVHAEERQLLRRRRSNSSTVLIRPAVLRGRTDLLSRRSGFSFFPDRFRIRRAGEWFRLPGILFPLFPALTSLPCAHPSVFCSPPPPRRSRPV